MEEERIPPHKNYEEWGHTTTAVHHHPCAVVVVMTTTPTMTTMTMITMLMKCCGGPPMGWTLSSGQASVDHIVKSLKNRNKCCARFVADPTMCLSFQMIVDFFLLELRVTEFTEEEIR